MSTPKVWAVFVLLVYLGEFSEKYLMAHQEREKITFKSLILLTIQPRSAVMTFGPFGCESRRMYR